MIDQVRGWIVDVSRGDVMIAFGMGVVSLAAVLWIVASVWWVVSNRSVEHEEEW